MLHVPDENCFVEPINKEVDEQTLKNSAFTLLRVVGMGCPTCATRVRNSLLSRPGVVRVRIDLLRGLAEVNYNPAQIRDADLLDAVAQAGGDGRHRYRAMLI